MALTSRLALEVDGRPAEQQIQAVRKALEGLTEVGLRAGPALSSVFSGLAGSAQGIKAVNDSLRAVQKALDALNTSGARAGQSLSGAAGSISATGANAAAAEARIAAAKRAMDALNEASIRATASLSTAANAFSTAGRNAAGAGGQVGALDSQMTSLSVAATRLAGPLLALFGVTQLVQAVYGASEAYSSLTNRMKLVTESAEELAAAQSAVFSVAQSAYQPLTATSELYQRIATNQRELKLTGEGVAGVVGTISKTLAISGASAASANAALIQLGQAFASGVLRGEELNSVMEQAPALAQAIARGMGKTVGELRSLGQAGLLTADTVVKALQAQQGAVDELFNKTAVTIGNSLTAFGNSFTQLIGRLDQASGASQSISGNIVGVSKVMDGLTGSAKALDIAVAAVGAALTGSVAAGAVLAANSFAKTIYAWNAGRVAAIGQAQATLAAANADANKARSAVMLAEAELALYRGTILQTVAAVKLAEARLLQTQADNRARDAALGLASAQASLLSRAGTGLLGFLGGPAGIVALGVGVAATAATFLLMRDNSDEATKALDQNGLSVQELSKKYSELNASQQRFKKLEWIDQQKEALSDASDSLAKYVDTVQKGALSGTSPAVASLTAEFTKLISEVRAGQRDLDSVNQWLKDSTDLSDSAEKALARTSAQYTESIQKNKDLESVLGLVDGKQKAATESANNLASAQSGAGTQTKAQAGETDKLIAKMKEEVALYGASEKVIAAYNAAKLNMNAQQTEQVRILGSIKDAQDDYKKAIQENDKVQQEVAKKQLVVLFTQQQAAEDTVVALKKAHDEAANAAKVSADKQIGEMQRVINAALKQQGGPQINLFPQKATTGYELITNGGTPPTAATKPRKTPQQLAAEATAQIEETVKPNKSTLTPKTVREDAGQKLLDDARQRYAVLQQQGRELTAQGGATKELGTEAKKLIELEFELANLKGKKTLTASQKQVLTMGEMLVAQQKQNVAAEQANDILKNQFENESKLAAFRESLKSRSELAQDELDSQLAGVGLGDKAKTRMQEDLRVRKEYQKEISKLSRDFGRIKEPTESDRNRFKTETAELEVELELQLQKRQEFYAREDELRNDWLSGAKSAWENYRDYATDYQSQVADATASILDGVTSSIASNIEDLIRGNQDLGDFFKNIALDMADAIIGALVKMAAQWLVYQGVQMLVGSASQLGAANTMIANAEATSLQAGLAAYASTAAIPIVGPILAPGAAGLAIGATQPMVAAIAAAALAGAATGGFAEGGYTGPGGKYEYAGPVHKGEVVWSQADIRRFGGVEAVESLRKGNVTPISAAAAKRSGMQSGTATGAQAQPQMNVAVHNYGSSQVETRQEGNEMQVIIREAKRQIAGDLARGNGDVHKALTQGYGLKRAAR